MTEDKKSAKDKVSDGIKQGIGVLSAFRDAIEETINEARERGDLSSDRAKEVMKSALDRAHDAAEGARERLDFVTQKDFDGLAQAVDGLRARVAALEGRFHDGGTTGDEPGSEGSQGQG